MYFFILYITRSLRNTRKELKEKELIAHKITAQSEELSIKNKNITDSINYAKHIIEAMMHTEKKFKQVFPDSFVLYLPKDIVSGDFFWIAEKDNKKFIAVIDCTGHGVPGALMSIISYELLQNIIIEQGVEQPARILDKLNQGISKTFASDDSDGLRDGMDMAFCTIDITAKNLEYAGAFNPLYVIRDNKILEHKADRVSVGLLDEYYKPNFTNQIIELQYGDILYLFTDGYADQFGGPDGKKFKYRRFRRLLLMINKLSMAKQLHSLQNSIDNWKGELEQVDDILVVGLKPF